MANPARQSKPDIELHEQRVLNKSFDREFDVLAVENLEYDGVSLQRQQSSNIAVQLDSAADPIIYVGKAPIGSATSSAVWQIVKLDTTSGLVKTWADGNASFDNIWDNRASLTYN
jgi:hypothetical protein